MKDWKKTLFGSFGLHFILLIGVALYFTYREVPKGDGLEPSSSPAAGNESSTNQTKKVKSIKDRDLGEAVPEEEQEAVIQEAWSLQEKKLADMSDEKKEAELQRGANLLRRSNVQEVEKATEQILNQFLPQEVSKEQVDGAASGKPLTFDPNSSFYSAVRKEKDKYIFIMKDKNGLKLESVIQENDMSEEDFRIYKIYALKNKYAQFGAILDKVSSAVGRMETPKEEKNNPSEELVEP